jgi:imidazolonepropionase-like amidohydrolase
MRFHRAFLSEGSDARRIARRSSVPPRTNHEGLALRAVRRFVMAALACFATIVGAAQAQSKPRPQLYAVRNVRLSSAPEALKLTLILRDGRIAAIQDAAKDPPPEARLIDGAGLIAMPAFLDAYSHAGTATPAPNAEHDVAPKPAADVLVDMRDANRKGIEPAWKAADVFKLDGEVGKRYRSFGFGALLSAPHGQLLSGTSVLASTRDAASRDVVIVPAEFDHAGFETPGSGYPGTLMGAVAQLRQFFLDAQRQRELERRRVSGVSTSRFPYDADLAAVVPALEKQRRVVCEADGADDIERWIKLGDELGFEIAISGGRDAWKRAALLSARKIPVFLTLDWGDEVDDPHAKSKKDDPKRPESKVEHAALESDKPNAKPDGATPATSSAAESEKQKAAKPDAAQNGAGAEPSKLDASKADAAKPGAKVTTPSDVAQSNAVKSSDADASRPDSAKTEAGAATPASKPAPDVDWNYEQPLRVREDLRRQWEERRDCALRLSEVNATFAFATGKLSPKDLLEHVRTLVEKGLSADVAQRALTSDAATLLGVGKSLGRIEAGFDATLALWTKNPLTSKDAKLAWLFVDGFPCEFDLNASEPQGKPDEGIDVTGAWTLEFDNPDAKPASAELKMSKDGSVKGTIRYSNPNEAKESTGEFEGRVTGKKLKLSGTVKIGAFESQVEIEGDIQDDAMKGSTVWKFSGTEDSRTFRATRKPKADER